MADALVGTRQFILAASCMLVWQPMKLFHITVTCRSLVNSDSYRISFINGCGLLFTAEVIVYFVWSPTAAGSLLLRMFIILLQFMLE
jgi:hypothetical protein